MGGEANWFSTLLTFLEEAVALFPDKRTGDNIRYSMRDVALSAFTPGLNGRTSEMAADGVIVPLNDLIEEWAPQMQKMFAEQDPNGNGKQDEIPLAFWVRGNGEIWEWIRYFGPWGVVDNIMIDDGTLRWGFTDPGFKEGAKFYQKLFKEGLLDMESVSQTMAQVKSRSVQDGESVLGVSYALAPQFLYADPDMIFKYKNSLGTLKTMNKNEHRAQHCPGSGGFGVGYYDRYGKITKPPYPEHMMLEEQTEVYLDYVPEENWPAAFIIPTSEESDFINQFEQEMTGYVWETMARWIFTDVDVDSEWDAFVSQIKRMKSDELLKIRQEQYDRYLSNF